MSFLLLSDDPAGLHARRVKALVLGAGGVLLATGDGSLAFDMPVVAADAVFGPPGARCLPPSLSASVAMASFSPGHEMIVNAPDRGS